MNDTGYQSSNYSVAATCSNCGHVGSVSRKKGEEMPEKDTCPNCGCFSYVVRKYFGGAK